MARTMGGLWLRLIYMRRVVRPTWLAFMLLAVAALFWFSFRLLDGFSLLNSIASRIEPIDFLLDERFDGLEMLRIGG
jgi:hypothetical protein